MVSKNHLLKSLTVFLLVALLAAPYLPGAVYAQEEPPTEPEATAESDDEIPVPPEASPADSDPAPEPGNESPELPEEPPADTEPTPEPFDDIPVPPGAFAPQSALDVMPSSEVGTIRYVAKSGTDGTNDCTSSTAPCLTIQHAVEEADAGDVIRIAAGTYLENLILYKALAFEGAGINQTFVNGNNTSRVFDNFSNAALSFSDMTITNGSVSGNGGGIYTDGALTMQRVAVTGNTANTYGGGGIYATDNMLLEDVSVTGNQTDAIGAGIWINLEATKTATLNRVTIASNIVDGTSSSNYGGGLQLQGLGTINLTNVTISNNNAWMGNAIYSSHGNVTIQNATIANNTTINYSGGGIVNYGTMTLLNTIIANNLPQNCASSGNLVNSLGYNISSDSTCNLTATGDQPSTNPNLGILADNGGYTRTHAIPATSLAVDKGDPSNCPAVDQRNYLRPADGDNNSISVCDIGAFEYHFPTTLAITSHTPDPSLPGQSVTVSVEVGGSYAPISGTVQIRGADTNCDIPLSGNSGSCNVVFNTSGAKTISANYLGDVNNDPASTSESHTVRTIITKTITSGAVPDGWVLESARTSNKGGSLNRTATTLRVGDDTLNRQYRSILHFNTGTPLPDNAVITSVKLQVKRASYSGTNPFNTHGALYVDMRKGAFSNNTALQVADWQAPASKSAAGKIPKTSASNWHTLNLAAANFKYINKKGMTQLRLRFAKQDNGDNGADYVNFYSGNAAAANRPKLIVTYYVP